MADNIAVTAGTGTTIGAKDIGSGVLAQRVLPVYGTGTDVSATSGLPIQGTQPAASSTAWTSATTLNTANTISVSGLNTVTVAMSNTSTMTGGVLTFEVSPDNTNWFPIALARIDSYTVETTYTLSSVANRAWSTSVDGFTNFRVRLSTVITGTGTATVILTGQTFAIEPIVAVGQATAANLQATVNNAQINGVAPLMGNGVTGTGSMRVTIASDNTSNTNPYLMREAATTTSSGLSIAKILSAATTNATSTKGSAGAIYGWTLINNTTTTKYVRIFNKASSPTVGTDSPAFVIPLPGSGGSNIPPSTINIPLGTGIAYAITGAAADLDATAVAANDVVGVIWYV